MEEVLEYKTKTLRSYLAEVNYDNNDDYIPSEFALEFLNFIKLVHTGFPNENKSPINHLKYLDAIIGAEGDVINLCHRGFGKTSILEYLILYLAVHGGRFPNFGQTKFVLYVSDTEDNGVKRMKNGLQYKYDNSTFLQTYLTATFTINEWKFTNSDDEQFWVFGYGASTGVRGTVQLGDRPGIALLDDLMSDKVANSPAALKSLDEVINGALEFALHPTKRKIIWSGTPFNNKDPIVKGIESGAYTVNVFPVCEEFPVNKKLFKGSWLDRFTYDSVLKIYRKLLSLGKLGNFSREYMLQLASDQDRLVQDHEIQWYKHDSVLSNKGNFNFYITTDFATSELESSDYSVISVWAYNNTGDWFWVDGICKRQDMSKNINDLFDLSQKYNPQSVGVEISGQQKGFISWIQTQMIERNIFFPLAKEKGTKVFGIRPNTSKLARFQIMVPMFSLNKMFFPKEKKYTESMKEFIAEIELATVGGLKSKHDDFLDTVSMLGALEPWKPSTEVPLSQNTASDNSYWEESPNNEVSDKLSSYMVN